MSSTEFIRILLLIIALLFFCTVIACITSCECKNRQIEYLQNQVRELM